MVAAGLTAAGSLNRQEVTQSCFKKQNPSLETHWICGLTVHVWDLCLNFFFFFSFEVIFCLLLSTLLDCGQNVFKQGNLSMTDLQVGSMLTTPHFSGRLLTQASATRASSCNRSITLNKLPVDRRRCSLILGPGDRVTVQVLHVDPQTGRSQLDLIRVLHSKSDGLSLNNVRGAERET
uniref:Uncharacterized protein n=1 Tax=Salarias fasciatus TaxID=181472 RepID=A0A672I6F7_SALFA